MRGTDYMASLVQNGAAPSLPPREKNGPCADFSRNYPRNLNFCCIFKPAAILHHSHAVFLEIYIGEFVLCLFTPQLRLYSRNTGGLVTGFDGVVADTWRLGLLAGYGNSSLRGLSSQTSIDSYQIGLYGGTQWSVLGNALGLRLGVNLGHNEIETSRDDIFDKHEASYDAHSAQVFGELGYEIKAAYADFELFAATSHVHLKSDGFAEDGETSALSGEASTSDVTMTTLGLRAARNFALSETTTLTTRAMLGWNHAFGDVTPESRLAFAGGQAFTTQGLPIAEDAAVVEAGLDVGIGASTTLGIGYTGQFSSRARDNAVKADLTVRF